MTPISNFKSTNTGTNNLKRNVLNSGCGGVGNFVSKNKRKRNKEKATKQIHKQNPVWGLLSGQKDKLKRGWINKEHMRIFNIQFMCEDIQCDSSLEEIEYYLYFNYLVCVCTHAHVPQNHSKQREAKGHLMKVSFLLLPQMWILRVELRFSSLVATAFTHWTSH